MTHRTADSMASIRLCGSWLAVLIAGLSLQTTWAADPLIGPAVETVRIEQGDLSVFFRDNSQSPAILSGVQSLFHRKAAPDFDAYDPDGRGSSAGLNFEHIIRGSADPSNAFTPRRGKYTLHRLPDRRSVRLVRDHRDSPWSVSSTFTYTVTAPNAIDFDFRCRVHDATRFGRHGYGVFFFANYMNDVADVPIHFRGVAAPGAPETWIRADAPPGHADYNGGGTYRSQPAEPLAYDDDHNFKLNLWSYNYPRFTEPFYYGRAAHGMVLILMFDRMHTPDDEIRFSLFTFKVPRHPRPAWDFQYVIRTLRRDRPYGFRGRLIWKPFVSPEDCRVEYHRWQASLKDRPAADAR